MKSEPAFDLAHFVNGDELRALIERARLEDLGERADDVTSRLCVPAEQDGAGRVVARGAGTLAGAAVLATIGEVYDPRLSIALERADGDAIGAGDAVAQMRGPVRSLLAMERVALNLLGHMTGIATMTARFVEAVAGTKARIVDTRKTLPGLRGLQKYAVACGGGTTHRMGLHDAMLVKDNHIAHLSPSALPAALSAAIAEARAQQPALKFVEVEVDSLEQLTAVLSLDVDIVLLDNMAPATLQQAVAMRDRQNARVQLEASGGVSLETVRAIAETGVERISVGALTHSPPAVDLAMDMT